MSDHLGVYLMLATGEREFHPDAHIAGVWKGDLVICDGPSRVTDARPEAEARRKVPLEDVYRVWIVDDEPDVSTPDVDITTVESVGERDYSATRFTVSRGSTDPGR